ncbi:MAG: DUF3306 domain-containing protein [Geminicoccaceae bacterium]
MTETDSDGFLTRWSRRKAAAREADMVQQPEFQTLDTESAPPAVLEAPPEAPKEPELPDPETLDATSDYRPFMRAGVPPELRRDALRKLWRANPIINSLDGLDDHYVTQDFTDGATVVTGLQTLYRVGKGMLEIADRLDPEATADQGWGPHGNAVPDMTDVQEIGTGHADQLELADAKSDLAHAS